VTTHITAVRTQATEPRLDQIARVLSRFEIVPDRLASLPPGFDWCIDGPSVFSWNHDDAPQITMEIDLEDDTQADALIRELRMCGFVAHQVAA
jgi:hypothetical protein